MRNSGERILKLIEYLKISKNKFSTKLLGLSASTKIDHIIRGRNDLTPEFAKEICYAVPELNFEWLYKGEGTMLKRKANHDNYIENLDINELANATIKYEDELLKHPLFRKMIERHSLIMLNEKVPELVERIYRIKS